MFADRTARLGEALTRRSEVAGYCIVDSDIGQGPETVVVVSVSEYCPAPLFRDACCRIVGDEAPLAVVVVPIEEAPPPLADSAALQLARRSTTVARYQAPTGDIETTVARVVAELVGLSRVSMSDHFLDLGGDSLGLLDFINLVEDEFEVLLAVEDVLDSANLREVADRIRLVSTDDKDGGGNAPTW